MDIIISVATKFAKRLVHRSLKRKGANDFQISSLSVFGNSATGAGKDELFELGYPSRDDEGEPPIRTSRKLNVPAPISNSIEFFGAKHMLGIL